MNNSPLVLIMESTTTIASQITLVLKNADYRTEIANTVSLGAHLITSLCPDLILLVPGLPDTFGLDILVKIRTLTDIPVIVLSQKNNESEKINALDMGADDYIAQPFNTKELLARIRACIRRHHTTSAVPPRYSYRHADLMIDYDKRLVLLRKEPVHLTQIEYRLLSLLSENSGKVMPYGAVMNRIWGPYVDNNNQILRVNMSNIRRKIKEDSSDPVYVFTVMGVGYRMADNESEKLSRPG